MRLRNVPGADEAIENSNIAFTKPEDNKGKWKDVFGNDNEVHIEIGMGKGQFLTKMAELNPNINYIGIEKYSSVLVRALEKLEELELDNIRFIRMDAENIENVFDQGEVDNIYLNFSDPWPKDRHAKRRLTSQKFLGRYDKVLKKDGVVEFKTDNDGLFEFSVEEAPNAGWNIVAKTWDLHNDEELSKGNVMTEYETKFSGLGHPIHKMIINR